MVTGQLIYFLMKGLLFLYSQRGHWRIQGAMPQTSDEIFCSANKQISGQIGQLL